MSKETFPVPPDETVYGQMSARGVSRRDFLKFCSWISVCIGVGAKGVAQVVNALDTKKRPPVIWLQFQECTGCTESFLRSSNPIVADVLLDKISLDYSETLMAAAGTQAEKCLQDTIANNSGQYILCCEGAVPTTLDGACCRIGGKSAVERLKQAASGAKAIVAWGNCASSGGIQAAQPNPTGATPIHKIITDKSVVRVQGCPPISDVMIGVIVYLLTYGTIPELDSFGRPKSFYNRRVHDTCNRRPSFEYGDFVQSFDDANARTGYGCLYKMGCRGLTTYNSCSTIRWNGGIGSPTNAGHGCIGCSEENFWDKGSFYDPIPLP